jgi:hypothetical protein
VTRCDDVTTSIGGEAAPRKKKGVDDASWIDANLIGPKNKKNIGVDSTGINGR